jgi:hypothetical protein
MPLGRAPDLGRGGVPPVVETGEAGVGGGIEDRQEPERWVGRWH